jgi:Zn-finger nucleic acid-binding protein
LGCRKCGGIFADNALSTRITSVLDRAIVADAFAHAARKAAQPLDLHGPKLSCPECSLSMLPNYVQAANVRVDACPEHGTFFDAHELEAVSRAYRRRREAGVPVAATPQVSTSPEAAADGIWQMIGSLFK